MELLDKIKNDLNNYCGLSVIYRFDENQLENIEEVKKMLNKDYGFLDIVLTKEDFEDIDDSLKNLEITKDFEAEFELHLCILKKVDPNTNYGYMTIEELIDALNEKSQMDGKKGIRLHVVFDDIKNELIQDKLNDLIASKKITVIGYATKELLTHMTSSWEFLQMTRDYQVERADGTKENFERKMKNDKH